MKIEKHSAQLCYFYANIMNNLSKKSLFLSLLLFASLALTVSACVKKPVVRPVGNQNVDAVINANQTSTTTTEQAASSTVEIDKLVTQIEDWKLYKKISNGESGIFDFDSCGDKEFDSLVTKVNEGEIYKFDLNGRLPIIYTPNYYHWTNNELKGHQSFCEAGAIYPRYAFADKIFWAGVCGTGAKPDISDQNYVSFQECLMAEEALNYFLRMKIK